MARGINKVILVGNLGKDPEVRYTPSGAPVATLSIATSSGWKDKQSGEAQERTEWHRVVMFKRLAEIAGEYLSKGSKVYVEGRLQTRKYDKHGEPRYITEVVVNEMQMLDSRTSGSEQRRPAASDGARAYAEASGGSYQGGEPPPDDFDDDIPF